MSLSKKSVLSSKLKPSVCPECGASRLMSDYDQGEIVCMDCGYVVDDKIADAGPEWRAYNREQMAKKTRVGAPMTYTTHDKGLSTLIDWHNQDKYGKSLQPAQVNKIFMLRKWQRRIRIADDSERNLAIALSEIKKISSALNLPMDAQETAAVFYRKAVKKKLIRGRSIHGIAAAAIYMACRKCNIPRTLDEIVHATYVGKKELGRCFRFLAKELNEFVPPIIPVKYISKFSNQLQVVGKAGNIAASIIEAARSLRLTSGRGPASIVAATIYITLLLAGERRTQREVATVANVTEVTVRNRYKELMNKLEIKMQL